jgi:hypothetical protein
MNRFKLLNLPKIPNLTTKSTLNRICLGQPLRNSSLWSNQIRLNHFVKDQVKPANFSFKPQFNKGPKFEKTQSRGFRTTPVPKALPVAIIRGAVYVGRLGLMALPYAYRYNIFKRYPKTTFFLLIVPLFGAATVIVLATDRNPYTERIRWLFQDTDSEIAESIVAKEELFQSLPIVKDQIPAELEELLQEVLTKVVTSTGESDIRPGLNEIKWYLVDLPDPQAFVIPDGTIFVYRGLLEFADNLDQLAFVLSHEISHYLSRHTTEAESFSSIVNSFNMFVLMSLQAVRTLFPFVTEISTVLALMMANRSLVKPYSRLQEAEADMMGLYLMARAGYDPEQVPIYWSKMIELENVVSENTEPNDLVINLPLLAQLAILVEELSGSTHPDSGSRKEAMELQLELAKPVVDFVKQHPHHKWVPLYECEFWKARMSTVDFQELKNAEGSNLSTLTHTQPVVTN